MIKHYVKKPISIEVVQYTGDNREELLEFTNGGATFKDENGIRELIIHTLEGDMMAAPGCYIARDPIRTDHFYPIQPDVFEQTYIEVKMIKCPKCAASYYKEEYTTRTLMYYPPIYKNGVNINPDRNIETHNCLCLNCHNTFSYQMRGDEIINIS